MAMYKWDSKYLKEFTTGVIIVNAINIESARKKVLNAFDSYDQKYYSCNYFNGKPINRNSKESIKKRRDLLEEDLKGTPIEDDVFFIPGSE